jgi:hypothetical protein
MQLPTVSFPSDEMCADLGDVDAGWEGPLEIPS